eukprot:20643-Heterococcus_DN1.PRE.3
MFFGEAPKLRRTGFSVILSGDEFIHRGPECPDELSSSDASSIAHTRALPHCMCTPLIRHLPGQPDMTTLHDNYQLAVKKYPNNNCYGWRVIDGATAGPYQWMTYKEANTAATCCSCNSTA